MNIRFSGYVRTKLKRAYSNIVHSTDSNKAGIIDYPRRVPFFLFSTTSIFLVILALPVCCTSRPPEM